MAKIERYERSLINYVWFIEFQRVPGGAKLLRNYRVHYNAPERPKSLGEGYIVESPDGSRTAVEIEFVPYRDNKKYRLKLVNPAHVFSYSE